MSAPIRELAVLNNRLLTHFESSKNWRFKLDKAPEKEEKLRGLKQKISRTVTAIQAEC